MLKKILGKAGAHFVWRPSKDSYGDNEALYKALGIRSLVEMATCSFGADIQTIATPAGEEGYICASAKRGICFYLWNRDRSKEEFKRLKDDGILAALLGAREASVDSLVLQYQLDGIRATDADAVTYFDRAKRTLYVSKATPSAKLDVEVPAYLARVLSKRRPPDGLRDFIARISGKTEQHLQYLIEQNDWRLPLEEREWMERAIADQLDLAPASAEEDAVVLVDVLLSTAAQPEIMRRSEDDRQPDKVSAQPEGPGRTAPLATASEEGKAEGVSKPLDAMGQTGEMMRSESGNDAPRARLEAQREQRSDFGDSNRTTQSRSSAGLPERSTSDKESQDRRSAYVESESTTERHAHGMDPEKLRAIEEAGIAAVEAYEWAHGRKPDSLKGNHPGWDINSFELILLPDASPDRRIEVKAKEGAWDDWGIALTPTEYESARRYSETYYLYMVEHAMDNERRRIHVFRNPAAKATEYRFRQDWRKYADEIS